MTKEIEETEQDMPIISKKKKEKKKKKPLQLIQEMDPISKAYIQKLLWLKSFYNPNITYNRSKLN